MSKKLAIILNIVFASLVMMCDVVYADIGGLWLKGVTSSFFVILGIVNLIYCLTNKRGNFKFSIIMVVGLFIAAVADVVLNLKIYIGGSLTNLGFMMGAGLFAVAHVFYFIAYCCVKKINWLDVVCSAVIFVPSVLFITLAPIFEFGGMVMEIICVVYAIIISFMVGKTISNLIKEKSWTNALLVVGSVLFFISDLMLLLNVFGNVGAFADAICIATYWPAQCFLAYSIFHLALENGEKKQEKEEKVIK